MGESNFMDGTAGAYGVEDAVKSSVQAALYATASAKPAPSNSNKAGGQSARFLPDVNHKATKGTPGWPTTRDLVGQIFLGPYEIGQALRQGNAASLPRDVWLGALINVIVTGWILNMTVDRPSPLDPFGLLASGGGQVAFGLFLTPAKVVKPKGLKK